jgi:hypothetical protein
MRGAWLSLCNLATDTANWLDAQKGVSLSPYRRLFAVNSKFYSALRPLLNAKVVFVLATLACLVIFPGHVFAQDVPDPVDPVDPTTGPIDDIIAYLLWLLQQLGTP